MRYGRVKLAHFRRGKLALLFSINKIFQKVIQYFIKFSYYISHILSPNKRFYFKNEIMVIEIYNLQNQLYKIFYKILHVGQIIRYVGQLTPMRGKLAQVYLTHRVTKVAIL